MAGAIRCLRVSLADIGRSMRTGALAKHRIKRVWRFLRNTGVDVRQYKALRTPASRARSSRVRSRGWVCTT